MKELAVADVQAAATDDGMGQAGILSTFRNLE